MADSQKGQISMKRMGVDKTNARIVLVTSVAAFLVVFFLVASVSLFSKLTYQNRVIRAKKQAVSQLKENLTASSSLVDAYKTFASNSENFIGGHSEGTGAQDGTNAKITLDALPSKYDFPALTASLEKVALDQKVAIQDISGTDDEVAQTSSVDLATPQPVEMPFEIKMNADFAAMQRVVEAFEHSIRPIQIQSMQITGDQQNIILRISAKTFYQPETTLKAGTTVIK